jgi:hypothetical protein
MINSIDIQDNQEQVVLGKISVARRDLGKITATLPDLIKEITKPGTILQKVGASATPDKGLIVFADQCYRVTLEIIRDNDNPHGFEYSFQYYLRLRIWKQVTTKPDTDGCIVFERENAWRPLDKELFVDSLGNVFKSPSDRSSTTTLKDYFERFAVGAMIGADTD